MDVVIYYVDMKIETSLHFAAERIGLTPFGPLKFGWQNKSAGCLAESKDGTKVWLRVQTLRRTILGDFNYNHGEKEAGEIKGVKKPHFLSESFFEKDGSTWHSLVSSYIEEPTVSETPDLTKPILLSKSWLQSLENSLSHLMQTPTERVNTRQDLIDRRIKEKFGDIDTRIHRWVTCHGDIHWANITETTPYLLDWEAWGLGPLGLDQALLVCFSLSHPQTAEQLEKHFHHLLSSPDGLISQLFVCAELLRMCEKHGDHLHLQQPLAIQSEKLIKKLDR